MTVLHPRCGEIQYELSGSLSLLGLALALFHSNMENMSSTCTCIRAMMRVFREDRLSWLGMPLFLADEQCFCSSTCYMGFIYLPKPCFVSL